MRTAAAAVLGFCFGTLIGTSWAGIQQHRAQVAEAALLEAQERAGAACEPVWMAAWPDGACSMRWGFPPSVSCAGVVSVYRHPDPERVRARLRVVGPRFGVTLYEERGAKERLVPVSWDPEVAR